MAASNRISKPNRPLSVAIVVVVNIVLATIVLATSFKGLEWGIPAAQVVTWVVLGLGISTTALLTWMGSRYARNAMLVLITLYLGLLLLQSIQMFAWANDWSYDESDTVRSAGRVVFSVVWIAANYWLLLGKRARVFFA